MRALQPTSAPTNMRLIFSNSVYNELERINLNSLKNKALRSTTRYPGSSLTLLRHCEDPPDAICGLETLSLRFVAKDPAPKDRFEVRHGVFRSTAVQRILVEQRTGERLRESAETNVIYKCQEICH
jgi:hypothetical protein